MMLATISHSMPPSTYPPSSGPLPPMATQLPITVAQRPKPKLSVNTAQPRSFGKGASLRLDTLSAVSPTKINTFSNAYPALERPSKPRLSIDSSIPNATSTSASPPTTTPAATTPTPSSASTLSSAVTSTSQESHESATISIPYKQPHNLVSILANSPVHSIIPRKMAASRPMFPPEKRVSFRTPLEEEITTVKYTLAHSDLEASVSTLSTLASTDSDSSAAAKLSGSDGSGNVSSLSSDKSASTLSSLDSSPRPKHPRIGDKRDSSSSEDEESDTCPETPVAGRRKRTRDWRWTLGPISGSDKSASSTASDATSDDSS